MIIYGKQLFLHVLERRANTLQTVYLAKDVDKSVFAKIAKSGAKVVRVDERKAQALARGGNHQGFLAQIEDFKFESFAEVKKLDKIAFLYGVSDVGNVGAITRTAYALGADALVWANKNLAQNADSQTAQNAAVAGLLRASSGAAFELPIALVSDPLTALNELAQTSHALYAAAAGGVEPGAFKFESRFALVMGGEGDGLPRKALEKCDGVLGIRMRESWDSLNVSVAFGILFDRIING